MTQQQLGAWCNYIALQAERLMPEGAQFYLVMACNAEPAAAPTAIHTASAGTMSARSMQIVFTNILHAVEVNPDGVRPGEIVDLTPPKGPAS